jgi:2,5-diketo-D-gluconate reductase B
MVSGLHSDSSHAGGGLYSCAAGLLLTAIKISGGTRMPSPQSHVAAATGMTIPALGFGTGGNMVEDCAEAVLAALRAGYRNIDTARKYGTEPGVGEAIRASGLPRDEIFLTTKVSHEDLHAKDFERSTETSLRVLGLDHVDLLMVHWPQPDMPFQETMGALAAMKRRGYARHVGVANFNAAMLDDAIRLCDEPLSALQVEYHPFLDQSTMLDACRRHGLVMMSYCPLGRGRVFDDPDLAEIAAAKGKTVSQIVLRWLIQQNPVVAIPSSSNPARIRENLDVFDFKLSDDEMRRVHALARPNGRIVSPKGRAPAWDN